MDDVPPLRIGYDASVDAAYVYLQSAAAVQPSVARTEPFGSSINLDFDDQGRLVGIEVFAARTLLHPELLDGSTGERIAANRR